MQFGFIGVGAMGGPVARNLIRYDYEVLVYDLNPEAIQRTLGAGTSGRRAAGLDDLEQVDCLFTSLPLPVDLETLMLGETGLLTRMKPGAFYVDLSTIDTGLAKQLDAACVEKGIKFLGCPLGRTPLHAERAEQPIYVGGRETDYQQMEPVLKRLGKPVYMGTCEASYACKLIGNMIGIIFLAAISEGLKVAENFGMDLQVLYDSLLDSGATSHQLTARGHKIVSGDFSSLFNLDLALKDIKLALKMSADAGVDVKAAKLTTEYFEKANAAGFGKEDCMAVFKVIENL